MSGDQPQFDVFLAHNSADKPEVRKIHEKLKGLGLNPWLDDEQILPGQSFQDAIQKAIPQIKSAAIFIGLKGLGRWQALELQALIGQFVEKGSPVIPVLLPGVDKIPDQDYLLFLKQFNWVSFADGLGDDLALQKLQAGITGRRSIPIGVQKTYIDPFDYTGPVWTRIVPETSNIGKHHLITINWATSQWQKVVTLPKEGLLLSYTKQEKGDQPRTVTVSVPPNDLINKVSSISDATTIRNGQIRDINGNDWKLSDEHRPPQVQPSPQ